RRVEDSGTAECPLEAVRDLEDATLSRDLVERGFAAAVSDIFPEDDDARIARHLVLQRAIDGGDHRVWLAGRRRRRFEGIGGRVDVRRVDVERRRLWRWLVGLPRVFGGRIDLSVDVLR